MTRRILKEEKLLMMLVIKAITKRLTLLSLSCALVVSSNVGRADDIEIYFNATDTTIDSTDVIRSNILFILDTSGSMTAFTSSGQTRLKDMVDATGNVLDAVKDLNVGLMRFTGTQGGAVIYPVSNINGKVTDVVGTTGSAFVSEIVNTAFIKSDLDDGEEVVTTPSSSGAGSGVPKGSVTLTDATLDAFDFGGSQSAAGASQTFRIGLRKNDGMEETRNGNCSRFFRGGANNKWPFMYSGNQPASPAAQRDGLFFSKCVLLGLRFPGVTIPNGTFILNAFLDFNCRRDFNDGTNLAIVGQDVGDAAEMTGFGSPGNDISSRNQTSATVRWNGVPVCNGGNVLTSPNIKTIVQEIVDRPDWASGQAMFFRTQKTNAPLDLGTGTLGGIVGSRTIGASGNSRRMFVAGEQDLNRAPRLRVEVASGAAVEGQDQIVALRFTDLRIPQGATITKAKLTLTPNAAPGVPVASVWNIRAEKADDSAPLGDNSRNISSRPTAGGVASIDWTVDETTLVTPDAPEQSVNIKRLLQRLVDRPGWCGGNATTLILKTSIAEANQTRFLHSHDSDSSKAPRLTYTFSTGSTGCMKARETAQTGLSADDAEQFDSSVDTIDNDLDIGFDTESGKKQTVGLRFQDIDIPKDATILDANIVFTSKGVSTGDATFMIKGINEGNVAKFSNTANDITSRLTTSAQVVWDTAEWDGAARTFETSDITPVVQEIINRDDWAGGNTMGFVIECSSSACNPRVAETADGDISKSPRIKITYQTILETPFKTNRDNLIELVKGLPASGATPIVPTLVEAAKYWRGEKILNGRSRFNDRLNRISHPGTYCTAPGSCPGATIDSSTDQFGVNTPRLTALGGCNMVANPDGPNCARQKIFGDPTYISPFSAATALSCGTNHIVLLTDGRANNNADTSIDYIRSLPGISSCVNNNSTIKRPGPDEERIDYFSGEKCATELVRFLHEKDQSGTLDNKQIIKTHTIGFDMLSDPHATQFLKDLANVGGGEFYPAENAGELVSVFENILTEVKNDPTSFASPALAANAFNRLLSRDEVYFGLFTPNLARAWEGNVKKYRICIKSGSCSLGSIIDANNAEAIDSANDKFKDSAQSIWSDVIDGKATTQGGAGHEITDFNTQILYTDKNNSGFAVPGQLLNGAGFQLKNNNWDNTDLSAMRSVVCPTPDTTNGSDCEKRMLFLLGKKNTTNPDTDINVTQRWSVNDVLHSSPVVVTYNGRDTNNDGNINLFFDRLLYGTNDGSLHMVNAETGTEEWRFMPSDFWGQQQQIFTNAEGSHIYGIDVSPTIQVIDNNSDGIIKSSDSDKVRAFIPSRRGGSNMYALDISADINTAGDNVTPRFLWRIQGGSSDFIRLGQTWSKPTIATIAVDTGSTIELREVLIFGGGYDGSLDNPATYDIAQHAGAPFMGNAIYIVDAENGERLLSISGSPSGADITVPDMNFSIPSIVRVFDSDSDGVDDRLYVGDTGGQVWRVDLAALDLSGTYYSTAGKTVVGKLADISNSTTPTKQRRFFEPPSVIQVRDTQFSNESTYDYILMGIGYRPHPLNREVEDRFYAFRDFQTGANEMRDDNANNISDRTEGYPQTSGNAFTNTDLINVTTTVLDSSDATHRAAAGWFYDFTQAGTVAEKVLSRAITLGGVVTFTTFSPEASLTPDPCGASPGQGTAYNFDILSAGAALDFDGDGSITPLDRTFELTSGIPSGVVPVFTTEGVIGIVGVEGGAKQLGKLADLPTERGFWFEDAEF